MGRSTENHPTARVAFSRVDDSHVRSPFARSTISEEKWGLLVVNRAVRQSRNITFILIPLSCVEASLCHREAQERKESARGLAKF